MRHPMEKIRELRKNRNQDLEQILVPIIFGTESVGLFEDFGESQRTFVSDTGGDILNGHIRVTNHFSRFFQTEAYQIFLGRNI